MMEVLEQAVNKINEMSDKLVSLENHVVMQDRKIEDLNTNKSSNSDSNKSNSDSNKSNSGSNKSNSGKKPQGKVKKSKIDRVEDEKARQLKLLQEKLKGNKTNKVNESSDSDVSSGESLNLRSLKKKLSRKQRDQSRRRVEFRLKQTGAVFPDDDYTSTSSSGTDTKVKCKHKRQIKSGAKVSKRPVLRTELWPHTIANEDDGDDVD